MTTQNLEQYIKRKAQLEKERRDALQGATRSGAKLILHSEDGVEARTMWKGIEVLVIPIEGSKKSELPFKDDVSFISPAFQRPVRIVRNNIIFEDESEEYL